MTIPWSTVENGIHSWVVSGSGLAADHVIWAQQSGPRPVGVYISLRFITLRTLGRDWTNWTNNEPLEVNVSVTAIGSSTFTAVAHGLQTGDGPVRLTGASIPTGLAIDTDYWVIRIDADTFRLASSFENSMPPVSTALTFTGGSTPLTVVSTDDTERVGEELVYTTRGNREATLSVQCFGNGVLGVTGSIDRLDRVVTAHDNPTIHSALVAAGVGVLTMGPITSFDGLIGQGLFEPRARMDVVIALASEVEFFGNYIATVKGTNQIPDPDEPFTISR